MTYPALAMWERATPDPELSWSSDEPPPLPWVRPGGGDLCPACDEALTYEGPRNPGLRFLCPICLTWIVWRGVGYEYEEVLADPTCSTCGATMVRRAGKYGEFWGCSMWAKTKCKGKPGASERVTVAREVSTLARWTAPQLDDVIDAVREAQFYARQDENKWSKQQRQRRR